ncbi:MAG: RNA polymerase sigma-70 factor [Saprospiraceae bacterium]|nr:RNA polymerase sigma-70 factor [Saprospiraceae bacterium]
MTENHDEERRWLANLQRGDESALDPIFDKYYPYLYRIAFQMLLDSNMAKDMVQDVFFKLWQNRSTIIIHATLKGYLQRAIINQCISFKRTQGKVALTPQVMPYYTESIGMQEFLEAESMEIRVREAIERLPDQCAQVFRLSRFEEMSYQEIADHLGIAPKTVENHISKALKNLRETLKPFLSIAILTGSGGSLLIF